ncbi:hypothetical protein PM082_015473 [Marasmius tenuissimus]|nr:hypothetical protein PM082_015473 [Marasmius tenuissimus]
MLCIVKQETRHEEMQWPHVEDGDMAASRPYRIMDVRAAGGLEPKYWNNGKLNSGGVQAPEMKRFTVRSAGVEPAMGQIWR